MKTEKKAVVRKSVKKSVNNNTPDWMTLEKFEMSFEHKSDYTEI